MILIFVLFYLVAFGILARFPKGTADGSYELIAMILIALGGIAFVAAFYLASVKLYADLWLSLKSVFRYLKQLLENNKNRKKE